MASVVWYIPNILCYTRIILAFVGLMVKDPKVAIALWLVAAFLDTLDGPLARRLKQTSSLGVLLDIIADNICRSAVWMAVAAKCSAMTPLSLFIISVEWLTFFATQFHAATQLTHWKSARSQDPKWIRKFFKNHFRNPLGAYGIAGLFGAGICVYIRLHKLLHHDPNLYRILLVAEVITYTGRLFSLVVELHLSRTYFSILLIDNRQQQSQQQAQQRQQKTLQKQDSRTKPSSINRLMQNDDNSLKQRQRLVKNTKVVF